MEDDQVINSYLKMIRSYTQGEETASEFSHRFINEFPLGESEMSEDTYRTIEAVFFAADAYHEDPELRGKYGIDEEEFLEEVVEAQRKLEGRLAEMGDSEQSE